MMRIIGLLALIYGLTIGVSMFCVNVGWMVATPMSLEYTIWAVANFIAGYAVHKALTEK